jgi:UDP-2,3-diacylglucosamine hydrolase
MEKNGKKIYFVADAHLGARFHTHPREVENKLVRWLDSIEKDASAVWLLGDIFDYWYEYRYVVPKGFTRFLGKLGRLADKGVEIHFLTGNHDVWMFDYLEKEVGAVVHRDVVTVDLLGRRFFLGHGDEVDFRSRLFRLIRFLFHNACCQWLYAAIHPRWTFGLAMQWSLNSRKKGLREEDALLRGNRTAAYLVRFTQEYLKTHPGIDFFLFGHCHVLLDEDLGKGARLLVAGDWMKLFSYVEWDGAELRLKRFESPDQVPASP